MENAPPLNIVSLAENQGSWWDDAFTRLLLDALPRKCELLVDYRCGLGRTAHALMPHLPDTRYLGLDDDAASIQKASDRVCNTRLAPRVTFERLEDGRLPLSDRSVDVVTSILGLQHCPDVTAALAEALRVLRPTGQIVAIEPDNLGQRFYFDGALDAVTDAILALTRVLRDTRLPTDIAIGPRLPCLLHTAGVSVPAPRLHTAGMVQRESARAFARRLERLCDSLAAKAGLAAQDERVERCRAEIHAFLSADMPQRVGYSAHVVPLFICAGTPS